MSEPVRIARGTLGPLLEAVEDAGTNRLPLAESVRLYNAGKPYREAMREREDLRNAIIKQYATGGEGVKPGDPGFNECMAKVQELWNEIVEITPNGPPVDLAPFIALSEDKGVSEERKFKIAAKNLDILIQARIVTMDAKE